MTGASGLVLACVALGYTLVGISWARSKGLDPVVTSSAAGELDEPIDWARELRIRRDAFNHALAAVRAWTLPPFPASTATPEAVSCTH